MAVFASPLGTLEVTVRDGKLTSVRVSDEQMMASEVLDGVCASALCRYFEGTLDASALPLEPEGTDFQRAVWEEARRIPAGETITYGELAKRIGRPGAARAVGQALNKNPILLFIPCHRIVPSGGGVGGFSCGAHCKQWLLEHERRYVARMALST